MPLPEREQEGKRQDLTLKCRATTTDPIVVGDSKLEKEESLVAALNRKRELVFTRKAKWPILGYELGLL